MKTLVAYYSRTGNTKKAAEIISRNIGADIDEVTDKKNRKKIIGWLMAGKDAAGKKLTEISYKKDPEEYDIVVIGTPIWSWTVTPAIRTYLAVNKLRNVAFFCTEGSSGGKKAFKEMQRISKKPIATLELTDKKIDDSREKIKGFCEKIRL